MIILALNAHDNLALQRLTRGSGADVPVSFFGNDRELDLDYWKTLVPEDIRTELAQLGFESTVLDRLKGPNEVLCAMAKWGNAHSVYLIKNPLTGDQSKRLAKIAGRLSSFRYYTLGPNSQCMTMRKMQFSGGGEISTQTVNVKQQSKNDPRVEPLLVRESEHAGEIERVLLETKAQLETIDAEWKVCQEEHMEYKKIISALTKDCSELKGNMQGGVSLSEEIRAAKNEIQKCLNSLPDIADAQAKLKRHRVKAVKELATAWEQFSKVYTELVNKL